MLAAEDPPWKQLAEAALAYAARGWHVFPLRVGDKTPVFQGGFQGATINPAVINRWWGARPYNIGIATGAISGLWVVDVDGGNLDGLPPTPEATTGRGRHLYFAYPRHADLRCTQSRIGSGIDTRGNGGYVIAPPSVHPSGAIYRWTTTGEPVEAPDWLIERARRKPCTNSERAITAARFTARGRGRGYGQAALADECEALAAAPGGTRNARLNRAAFCLFQLVAGGELTDEGEVVAALMSACDSNGLLQDGEDQCRATIRSGAEAGLQHPRGRAA
jgi:hypothetical protein